MSGLNFMYKFCARQSCRDSYGFKLFFSRQLQVPKVATVCNYNTYYKRPQSSSGTSVSYSNAVNYLPYRGCMAQAAVEENGQCTIFQSLMLHRKNQAQRSVLLEVSKEEDIPYALAHCEKFGGIAKVYSYPGESSNHFLLLEFADASATQHLLLNCHVKNIADAFPIFSRLIRFEKKGTNLPKSDIEIIEDSSPVSSSKKKASISDLIEDIYSREKISELNARLRHFFCILVKDSISGLFPYCDVLPFGSSVNGIGKHGCDLDVMIRLYPEQANSDGELSFLNKTCIGDIKVLQQRGISCLGEFLKTFFPGVSSMQKILHARMPIFKLKHRILKLDCDVSINNMSAILMSEIIHFCGEIDSRVRPLLYAVKKWAKADNVTHSVPGTYITNFGLTVLVLFFLQNRPTPILPSFNDALVISGEDSSPEFRIQYLKSPEELKRAASLNEESLALLLKEFLFFLGSYSFKTCVISLMTGKTVSRKDATALWVQYPFEEDLNITKNISDYEFCEMTEKAMKSSKHLENSLNQNVYNAKDLVTVLGISNLKRKDSSKSKFDVNKILNSPTKSPKNKVK